MSPENGWQGPLVKAQNHLEKGEFALAKAPLLEAVALAKEAEQPEAEASALGFLVQCHLGLGEASEAEKALQRGQELAQKDPQAAAYFAQLKQLLEGGSAADLGLSPGHEHLLAGRRHLQNEEYAEAVGALKTAKGLAQEAGARGPEATACGLLAHTLAKLNQKEEALEIAQRGLALARELANPAAEKQFEELLALIPQLETAEQGPKGLAELVEAGTKALRNTAFAAAEKRFREALQEASNGEEKAQVGGMLAQSLLRQGEIEAAAQALEAALKVAEGQASLQAQLQELSPHLELPSHHHLLFSAQAQLDAGRPQEAEQSLEKALKTPWQGDVPASLAGARFLLAQAQLLQGLADLALETAQMALQGAEAGQEAQLVESCKALLADLEKVQAATSSNPS